MTALDSINAVVQGTESSRVEAILRAVPDGRPPALSGLEATAPGGDGEGIEPFRPAPRLVEIGISMRVPLDKVHISFFWCSGDPCRNTYRTVNARASRILLRPRFFQKQHLLSFHGKFRFLLLERPSGSLLRRKSYRRPAELQVAENLPPRPPPTALDASMAADAEKCRTDWRRWTEEEGFKAADDAKEGKRPDPLKGRAGIFAGWLSGTYARCDWRLLHVSNVDSFFITDLEQMRRLLAASFWADASPAQQAAWHRHLDNAPASPVQGRQECRGEGAVCKVSYYRVAEETLQR